MFITESNSLRNLFLGLFFILLFHSGRTQAFSRQIVLPNNADQSIQMVAKDAAHWLNLAFKDSFSIVIRKNAKPGGIILEEMGKTMGPAHVIEPLVANGQAFHLEVNKTVSARIIGSGTASFVNGLYTFLHILGFRWYMPGDAWTIIPDPKTMTFTVKKLFVPHFQNRSYFGTGGLGAVTEIDPKNTFKQDFDAWNIRNRFGSDFTVLGHMGQGFYLENKAILHQHPEYFCGDKINPNGRIDLSNKAAVDLFAEWATSRVDPKGRFINIGVDPADGSGGTDDCLPSNMKDVKSWSDKYFWLANQVAQKARDKKLEARVQLYAYSSYAAPPRFDLDKMVYPVIIPYAFQQVADPEDFVKLWQKKLKGRPMGLYDYWNITQWSQCTPQFNIFTIAPKIKFWRDNNITTVNIESTNSKGPMGHALWLAGQLMWDCDQNFEVLFTEFLINCFGAAAPEMRRMYARWSQNPQGPMEVTLSMHDLDAAANKVRDTKTLQRLTELKAYVLYLKYFHEYMGNKDKKAYEELVGYIKKIHHFRLVQTFALINYYIPAPPGYKKLAAQSNSAGPGNIDVQLLLSDIEKRFTSALKAEPPIYKMNLRNINLSRVRPVLFTNKQEVKYMNGKNVYQFYLPQKQKFQFKIGATDQTRLSIRGMDGKLILEREIKGSDLGYESVEVTLDKGSYELAFGEYYRFSRMVFPNGITFLATTNIYDNAGYPPHWVYVPKGISEIVYQDDYGPGTNGRGYWYDPDGKKLPSTKLKEGVYSVKLAKPSAGETWKIDMGHRSWKLLNIPHQLSLSDFSYAE